MTIANHNPLNIKQGRPPWKGSIDTDQRGHAIFVAASDAYRAGCRTLANYQNRHGLRTLNAIFARWAPTSDSIGSVPGNPPNDPNEYARYVARRAGLLPFEEIELFTPKGEVMDRLMLHIILAAMTRYECGANTIVYPEEINDGISKYEKDFVQ